MKNRLILILLLCIGTFGLYAQTVIPLYTNNIIPNAIQCSDKEKISDIGNDWKFISNISKPTISVYLPQKCSRKSAAVLIFPGGGYSGVAITHEGNNVAREFNKMGIAAFVVKYRNPNPKTMTDPKTGPLQDAQQAIALIRKNSAEWNIDPNKVGALGFSAGGHLVSTLATHFTNRLIVTSDTTTSLRPDFILLIYPVISFSDSLTDNGTRRNLIGENRIAKDIENYSNELHVNNKTPPTFIVHAEDDKVVKVMNSLAFYEALYMNKVLAELHIYSHGGHGFGLYNNTTKDSWIDRAKNWLKSNKWIE
jgi:acetyl esterase/lipase